MSLKPANRICSLLPSATEIVGRLGLADRLVCVTHECDVAPNAPTLEGLIESGKVSRVTSSAINPAVFTQVRKVRLLIATGMSWNAPGAHPHRLLQDGRRGRHHAMGDHCHGRSANRDALCCRGRDPLGEFVQRLVAGGAFVRPMHSSASCRIAVTSIAVSLLCGRIADTDIICPDLLAQSEVAAPTPCHLHVCIPEDQTAPSCIILLWDTLNWLPVQTRIDDMVTASLGTGDGLYGIDNAAVAKARPDLIITQQLCTVCAPSGTHVAAAMEAVAASLQNTPLDGATPTTVKRLAFEGASALLSHRVPVHDFLTTNHYCLLDQASHLHSDPDVTCVESQLQHNRHLDASISIPQAHGLGYKPPDPCRSTQRRHDHQQRRQQRQ